MCRNEGLAEGSVTAVELAPRDV
ncbi:hypothetical protein [Pseudonocardia halophobica]|nr:hypothetical protein [Pseudonocardia halophobica]